MFPTYVPEVVQASRSARLEGYRHWALRHGRTETPMGSSDEPRPVKGHRPRALRPALGR